MLSSLQAVDLFQRYVIGNYARLPVCLVRVTGDNVDQMTEELWSSGHAVVNVIHFAGAKEKSVLPQSPQPFRPFVLPEQKANGLYPSE